MTFPSSRDWLFSAKTFGAAMLALYLALKLELPRPYWAMATVYVVSNPFVGATRSKALYRALGTLLGAAAAIFFVPPLVQTPFLLSLVIALWTGTLLYFAISDRTARSYVFMLAGYTLPLIAFPVVTHPDAIFDVAVARSEEIILGIVCASVVSSVLFPSRLAPVLSERMLGWFRDAAAYSTQTLDGRGAGVEIPASRQRLASFVNGLEFLLSQLAYDHANPQAVRHAQALRQRMTVVLPVVSALVDPLAALRARPGAMPGALEHVLADTGTWIAQAPHDPDPAIPDRLRASLAALEPAPDALGTWEGALVSLVLWRLKHLVDLWQDCRELQDVVARGGRTGWTPHFRHWRFGSVERHFDRAIMLFSTGSAVAAIFVASALWILLGWTDGAGAVSLAAVACCFFAALDEPAPQVFNFFIWTSVSVLMAGIYLFVILPNVHNFEMLVIMFAVPFLFVGTLIPQPRFNLATMLVAVNTASFISIQSAYDANFQTFVNSNLAGPLGLLFAYVWTRVTRPFGVELAARRLIRANWADAKNAATPSVAFDHRAITARMVDRLMQLLPRLGATDGAQPASLDSIRDLRAGLNSLDLQAARQRLEADLRAPVEQVLDGVRGHFQACLDARARLPAPARLRELIDEAMHRAAVPETARRAHDALNALAGLRLSLFPEAFAPVPGGRDGA